METRRQLLVNRCLLLGFRLLLQPVAYSIDMLFNQVDPLSFKLQFVTLGSNLFADLQDSVFRLMDKISLLVFKKSCVFVNFLTLLTLLFACLLHFLDHCLLLHLLDLLVILLAVVFPLLHSRNFFFLLL